MEIEIEAKMRLPAIEPMQQVLRDLGGEYLGELLETNTYFDDDEGRLKSTDQGLRIRVELDEAGRRTVMITHKGPRAHGKLKSRSEAEIEVAEAHGAAELLSALGYEAVLGFEKRRRRWRLDGCAIELDTLPYLGSFIEIEGPSEGAVLAVRDRLGLGESPLIKTSYIAMLMTHAREHRITDKLIHLEADARADVGGLASHGAA